MCLAGAMLLGTILSSVSLSQQGPSIAVRVLSAKSGRPLEGVLLLAGRPTKLRSGGETGRWRLLSARTNAEGLAVLRLPERVSRVIISYGDLSFGQCSPRSPVAVADILRTGIVAQNTCSSRKLEDTAAPKPGELVLFAKKWSWWERMRHSE